MWKNVVERGRPQMAIWGIRILCWIPKATNTHSQYVILIAFSLQKLLHERASLLRHSTLFILLIVGFGYESSSRLWYSFRVPHIMRVPRCVSQPSFLVTALWYHNKCAVVTGCHGYCVVMQNLLCHVWLWRHNPVCMRFFGMITGPKFMLRTVLMVAVLSKHIRAPILVWVQVDRKLGHRNIAWMGFEIML